jgi:hypothetical protein
MNDEAFSAMLKNIPGAKRAEQGVILPGEDGGFMHVQNVYSAKDLEGLSSDEQFYFAFCSKNEILRLRGLRNAHDYLLRLRANAIVDSPRAVLVMSARRSKFKQCGKPWSLSHYYHSMDHYHKSYISQLSKNHSKTLKSIPSGMSLISEANAVCIRSFAGDVVVVSETLEKFFYFLSIAFYGDQLDIELIDRVDASLIALRIMNGTEALDFDLDPRGELPEKIERYLSNLVKHQMQFTFGHEFAHLLRGHLLIPDTQMYINAHNGSEKLEVDFKVYEHEFEFEADLYSLKHITQKGTAFNAIVHGAFSVLLFLDFLDNARREFGLAGLSFSKTHPTPKERITRLQDGLGRKSSINSEELSNSYQVTGELLDALKYRVSDDQEETFGQYGSVYLPNYTSKLKRDRFDF